MLEFQRFSQLFIAGNNHFFDFESFHPHHNESVHHMDVRFCFCLDSYLSDPVPLKGRGSVFEHQPDDLFIGLLHSEPCQLAGLEMCGNQIGYTQRVEQLLDSRNSKSKAKTNIWIAST